MMLASPGLTLKGMYPELARGSPRKLLVLGSEIGGRWNTAAQWFVRDLVRLRALRAPPAVRAAASSGIQDSYKITTNALCLF